MQKKFSFFSLFNLCETYEILTSFFLFCVISAREKFYFKIKTNHNSV